MGKKKNRLLNSLLAGDFGKHVLDALFARYGSSYSICFYRPDWTFKEYLGKRLSVINKELRYLEGQLGGDIPSTRRVNDRRTYSEKLFDAQNLHTRKEVIIEKLKKINRNKHEKPDSL